MRRQALPQQKPWRSKAGTVLLALLLAALVLAGVILGLRIVMQGGGGPFGGDEVLSAAARAIREAEAVLRESPDDQEAHLARARAYLDFGYLEGARLEWRNRPRNADPGWDEVGRELDELEQKTAELRRLVLEAETSSAPSEKYPPIYLMLDDLIERFDGVPRYRALFLKGYLLLREGRRAEAGRVFSGDLRRYQPLKEYIEYNLARSLMVRGSEERALEALADFIREFPESRLAPLAYLERINLLRDLGRNEDAAAECRRSLDSYPTGQFAAKTLRKLAELYESAMDFDNGAAVRVRIIQEFPDSEESRESISMFFNGVYSLGLLDESARLDTAYSALSFNTDRALEVLASSAQSQNLSPEQRAKAAYGAGMCEYRRGRYYEAIEWFKRAAELGPSTEWAERAGIWTGNAFKSLGKYDLAAQSYRAVAAGHGSLGSDASEILWKMQYELSDLATVAEMCRVIVDEYPLSAQTPAAMAMLAYLGCRQGQYQTARGYGERFLRAFPNHSCLPEAEFWLARALQGLGRSVDAREEYRKLAQRFPWSFWGIRAAELLGERGGADAAVDPFSFDPSRMTVFDGSVATAWELYEAGILDLAESEFELALLSGERGARCGLALVQAEKGNIHNAQLTLREAALLGDQAFLTPGKQERVLKQLYPMVFEQQVREAALAHDVPTSWLWGTMRQESSYNPRALSSAGARGLIQIMPETGRFIAAQRGASSFNPDVLWDPATNLDYSAWYFAYLRERMGNNLFVILASYNGGPGRVSRWREQLPIHDDDIFVGAIPREETRSFTRWVYSNVRMYEKVEEIAGYQIAPF